MSSHSTLSDQRQDFARRAVGGVAWVYLTFVLSRGVTFLTTLLLARLLSVGEFGLVGYALLVVGFVEVVKDLGVSTALITQMGEDDDQTVRSTAFALTLIAGTLLTAGMWSAAPIVAGLLNAPEATPLVQALALTLLISSFSKTHEALLQHDLGFRKRLLPEIGQVVVKGGVSVWAAWQGYGAWSIVYGQIAGTVAATILSWIVFPWMPSARMDGAVARRLLGFGKHIVGLGLLTGISLNVDYLLVGRFLGAEALGFYTLAFRLPDMLLLSICWALSRVLFPVFARLQHDPPALRHAYLESLRYTSAVVIPLGLGIAGTAPVLIPTLFGEKWAPAIPILQVLALYSTQHAVFFSIGDVFKALGLGSVLTRLTLLGGVVLYPLMVLGLVVAGPIGVAASWVVGDLSRHLLSLRDLRRAAGVSASAVVLPFRAPLVAAVVMLLAVAVIERLSASASWITLVLQVAVGGSVYLGILLGLDRGLLQAAGWPRPAALLEAPPRGTP